MAAANTRLDTLSDIHKHGGNLRATCQCGHRSVLDVAKLNRLFFAHRWGTQIRGQVAIHLRCSRCGRRPIELRPTIEPISAPDYFPRTDDEWKRLVRRLRD